MTAAEIIMLILTGLGVATAIVAVVFTGRTQRNEIRWGFEPASKEEFEKHREWNNREHENFFKKIGGVERGANDRLVAAGKTHDEKLERAIAEGNESRRKLHESITDLIRVTSWLKGRLRKKGEEETE